MENPDTLKILSQYTYEKEVLFEGDIDFNAVKTSTKIRVAKSLIYHTFPYVHQLHNPKNCDWFIKHFLSTFKTDYYRPWLSGAIQQAMGMMLNIEDMNSTMVALPFMYALVEYYVKTKLGFEPLKYDTFDNQGKREYLKKHFVGEKVPNYISIAKAFDRLSLTKQSIALSIAEIDNYNKIKIEESGIEETGWNRVTIIGKLDLSRNLVMHGEIPSFYIMGKFLVILYILFYLHDQEDFEKQKIQNL